MSESEPRVSVVVPTYNERDNLAPLAERVFGVLGLAGVELLIVDDDSPDGTAGVAAELAGRFPVRCIVRKNERGLATAVIAGLREARGELCVVMDADLSHPPEAIPRLLEAMGGSTGGQAASGTRSREGEAPAEPGSAGASPSPPPVARANSRRPQGADATCDMAIGSRFVPGGEVDLHWPLHRRLNSLVGRLLARPLTPVKDMMAGFFCVRRADLKLDLLKPVGYKIALELIVRHGWKNVVEVPITFSDRAAGKTKLSVGEQLRYLRHLWRLYTFVMFGRR